MIDFDFKNFMTDENYANKILKIANALWIGKAKLIQKQNNKYLTCKIGDRWFYFMNNEDKHSSPAAIKQCYNLFTISRTILETINQLNDEEYNYYHNILNF